MNRFNGSAFVLLATLGALASACANSSSRYPSLSLRDFERVQGQFAAPDPAIVTIQAAPLSVKRIADLAEAMESARERHQRFLRRTEQARPIIASAANAGVDEKRWTLAMVELADLDSHLGATTSLLADLDALYANASLDFEDRKDIASARQETAGLVREEQEIVGQFARTLGF